jgi:hypothetical protein
MSTEPEKAAATPASETATSPVSVPVTIFSGKPSKGTAPGVPGEPYTPMPDLSKPARPRWLYALAALLLALAAAAGMLFMRGSSTAPASQPAPIEAPANPGPQAGN